MKNCKLERYRKLQLQYHRNNPIQLTKNGIRTFHDYSEIKPDDLSWWDDFEFILNRRRVIVWWMHPRMIYVDEIDNQVQKLAGNSPFTGKLFDENNKVYKKVGTSRKKVCGYSHASPIPEQNIFYKKWNEIEAKLKMDGIEYAVTPSYKIEQLTWAIGIHLVVPLEVCSEADLTAVADIARRLLLRQTTLEAEFHNYHYDRKNWLQEQKTHKV